jgi:hypothetical protein
MQQQTTKNDKLTHTNIAKRVVKRLRGQVRYLMHQKIWYASSEASKNPEIKPFVKKWGINASEDGAGEVNVNFIYREMMKAMNQIHEDFSYSTIDEFEKIEKLVQVYSVIDQNKK